MSRLFLVDNSEPLLSARRTMHLFSDFPEIVTLCGSTRFKDAYEKVTRELTLQGKIVISVGLFGHMEGIAMNGEIKKELDELHKRKVDLCDVVYVINVGGYIGESTKSEIEYAKEKGKRIRYLVPLE